MSSMNAAPPSDHVYARRWLILGILSVSVFLVVVDNLIVNVALPMQPTRDELHRRCRRRRA